MVSVRHVKSAGAFVLIAGMWTATAPAALATTFGFDDVVGIYSTARRGDNSQSNFDAYFGAQYDSQYVGAGMYQITHTGPNEIITQVTRGVTSFVGGEYVVNATPNASQELTTNGFGQSLNNGQTVDTVFNLSIAPFIRYAVNGVNQLFTFNSFDLKGSGTITVQGASNLNVIFSKQITLTNSFQTFNFDWAGVDTIEFNPNFGGSDFITMDNVVINNAVASVAEPASLTLLGLGLAGLVFRSGDGRRGRARHPSAA